MVAGGDSRGGTPVVSVAELIARDAPWSGAPEAVDVTGGPAAGIPAQRASSRPDGRPAPRGRATGGPATGGPAARVLTRRPAGDPLRRFVAAAWSPNWRIVTLCACVLVAGLLSNVVLLTATSEPDGGAQAAGSDEGGYPADVVDEPPALSIEPPPATLPGLGLPLALSSLGRSIPTAATARTTPAATSALVGVPASGGASVITGSGSTAATSTGGSSRTPANDGSLGGTVAGVGRVAGGAVEGLGGVVGGPVGSTVKDLGRTTEQLTDTVGGTVNGLLGGSRESTGARDSGSRGSHDSDDSRDPRDSRDSRDDGGSDPERSGVGGVLGGLLGGK